MIYVTNAKEGRAIRGRRQRLGPDSRFPESEVVERSAGRVQEEGCALARICCTSSARSYAQKALTGLLSCGLLFAAEPSTQSRTIRVTDSSIIPVTTEFGYTTIVVLPEGEEIMEGTQFDSNHFWNISPQGRYLQVKALGRVGDGVPGQQTNINVMTVSGNLYTFLVKEASKQSGVFDLRVDLEQDNPKARTNIEHPKYVAASAVDTLKEQLKEQRAASVKNTQDAEQKLIKSIKHDYVWDGGKLAKEFGVKSMYEDGNFFYIEADSAEAPALYEMKDGKPAIVQYSLANGVYTVPHVVESGYLNIGKQKLNFRKDKS